MSDELAILVPVLDRPRRLGPLLDSIKRATPDARVLFLTDPGDVHERHLIRIASRSRRLRIDEEPCGGNYAAKINLGVTLTQESLLFLGADDIHFHAGWLEKAQAHMADSIGVVGTQDRCNPRTIAGEHSTHFLLARWYAEQFTVDGEQGPLHEGYAHNFCDSELIATARRRGAYVFAADAVVEHHHPMNSTAPDDDTYRAGRETFARDRRLFRERRRLWM